MRDCRRDAFRSIAEIVTRVISRLLALRVKSRGVTTQGLLWSSYSLLLATVLIELKEGMELGQDDQEEECKCLPWKLGCQEGGRFTRTNPQELARHSSFTQVEKDSKTEHTLLGVY